MALLFWHLPGPFDLAEQNQLVHIWGMHGSFFVFGVLFWMQVVDSRLFKVRLSAPDQIGVIFTTAVLIWVLAMAMSILAGGSWYTWYQVHEGPLLSPFAHGNEHPGQPGEPGGRPQGRPPPPRPAATEPPHPSQICESSASEERIDDQ